MASKNSKTNSGLYIAVFFVAVLFILILFFVKKNEIASNLKRTNFFERLGVSTPEFIQKHPENTTPPSTEEIELNLLAPAEESLPDFSEYDSQIAENEQVKDSQTVAENSKTETANQNTQTQTANSAVSQNQQNSATAGATTTEKPVATTRTTTLYFVTIGSDGSVNRKAVKRELPKSDSPLTDAIKALLAGPLPAESNTMNLIPQGTRLIGASVKNGVATLNFNEKFEYNDYGIEGSNAQLMQIVYTATEFSTVRSVQFLIEGEKKDYLGTDGQLIGRPIGSPLSRSSF